MSDAGLVVLTAFISPFRSDRDLVRALLPAGEFIEILVDAPLEECERRDPKGLYKKARAGMIPHFTGIDSPYETPINPTIHPRTDLSPPDACADQVIDHLVNHGFIHQSSKVTHV
jgi:adenylylsulfate kinase-like enzyme